jgi:protein disulfide-isomerase A6
MFSSVVLFAFGIIVSVNGFYSSSDDVVQLDPSNFDRLVIQSSDLWIVEFYASWCGRKFLFLMMLFIISFYLFSDCQQLTPEWKRAATALKGIVKIGAVDADTHKSLGQQYGVSGFPTIKVFGTNKRSPTNYQGGRTADAIVDQALSQLKTIVNERMGKRGGGSSSGGGGSGSGDGKDAVELTDSNFQVNYL